TQYLLAPDFFGNLNLPWLADPWADQYRAGEIAWGVGEVPTLILALIVTRNWVRQDRLETKRKDRQARRDGDAELVAYNDGLGAGCCQADRLAGCPDGFTAAGLPDPARVCRRRAAHRTHRPSGRPGGRGRCRS